MSRSRTTFLAPLGMAAICLTSGCSGVVAKASETPDATRKNVELTVYKEDFAVVKEDRPVTLKAGRNEVGLLDVSKSLDQDSVMLNWPDAGKAEVISSTYNLGIGESNSLLRRFLGKQVDLVRFGQDGKEAERQHGILEVADAGQTVINVDGKYLINPEGTIEAPSGDIVTIPQLSAEVQSPDTQNTDLRMTYLTSGLSWSSDYSLTLPSTGNDLSLECWANVVNQTGTDYPDAKISFVAGSPNRADMRTTKTRPLYKQDRGYEFALGGTVNGLNGSLAGRAPVGVPSASGELYSYPLTEPATIAQNQENRVKMLSSDKVSVHRDYSIRLPSVNPYGGYYDGGEGQNPDQRFSATVAISFKNTKDNGLGEPLPGGAVRVYEPNKAGSLAYVGAATVSDTPQGAGVYLTLSNVFDVYSQFKIVKRQKVDKRTMDVTLEIPVHNEKASAADIRLVTEFDGSWKIMTESEKSKKLDSQSNQWTVQLAPGEEKTVKAVIRFKV